MKTILESPYEIILSRLDAIEERLSKLENRSRDVSEDSIDSFIDKILEDPETNTIIPDIVERELYKKLLMISMKTLQKTIESTKISIFNHEIELSIHPVIQ